MHIAGLRLDYVISSRKLLEKNMLFLTNQREQKQNLRNSNSLTALHPIPEAPNDDMKV